MDRQNVKKSLVRVGKGLARLGDKLNEFNPEYWRQVREEEAERERQYYREAASKFDNQQQGYYYDVEAMIRAGEQLRQYTFQQEQLKLLEEQNRTLRSIDSTLWLDYMNKKR
jgi:hypothetical protein